MTDIPVMKPDPKYKDLGEVWGGSPNPSRPRPKTAQEKLDEQAQTKKEK